MRTGIHHVGIEAPIAMSKFGYMQAGRPKPARAAGPRV
jgi:hypothetical protein